MNEEQQLIYYKIGELLEKMREAKPEDRSELARRIHICVTDLEKIMAYWDFYVLKG